MTTKPNNPNEQFGFYAEGHIKIFDPDNKIVYQDKRNAIHFENMSIALANSLISSQPAITKMAFGNGGTVVDPTGIITYLTPNTVGTAAGLYNEEYVKDLSFSDFEVSHLPGTTFSDLTITCLLDFNEPGGQPVFDGSAGNDEFVFDELGLVGQNNQLLTHVVFHPVQKASNRRIQIDYTIRIQSLTTTSADI